MHIIKMKVLCDKKTIIIEFFILLTVIAEYCLFANEISEKGYVIIWTILVGLIIMNLVCNREDDKMHLYTFILLIFAIILIGATNDTTGINTDYYGYKKWYETLENSSSNNFTGVSDAGFLFLMRLGVLLGLNYNGFATLIGIIGLFLIFNTVKLFSRNFSIVLALYMIVPFTYDVIQIRFFFAYSIVFFGLRYIIFLDRYSPIKFLIVTILASTIHFSIIFFIVFLIAVFEEWIKKTYKFIVLIGFLLMISCYVSGTNILSILPIGIVMDRASHYMTAGINISIFTAIFIFFMLVFYIFVSLIIKRANSSFSNNKIFIINIISIIFMIFIPVSLEFERYLRPVFILNYANVVGNRDILDTNIYKRMIIFQVLICTLREAVMFNLTQNIIISNYLYEFLFEQF